MNPILTALDRFSGIDPIVLVHAPFVHPANITPFASLNPALPYDLTACAGQDTALFASRDKVETLGLLAQVVSAGPKTLAIFWPNDWGGKGLKGHLQKLGVAAQFEAKLHAQMAFIVNPATANGEILNLWQESAAARNVPGTDRLQAQAGLFSYRGVDPASALLLQTLPKDMKGHVADFGCGWGYLSQALLARYPGITKVIAIDDDKRAVERTASNIVDPRLETQWADITKAVLPERLGAVVMNPPFHMHGKENHSLGQSFIERAAQVLQPNGVLYMVANRHLPYEGALKRLFKTGNVLADQQGYKVIAANK